MVKRFEMVWLVVTAIALALPAYAGNEENPAAIKLAAPRVARLEFPASGTANYEGMTRIAVGADAGEFDFVVTSTQTQKCETAWSVRTARLPVSPGTGGYAFEFEIRTEVDWLAMGGGGKWGSHVFFYDADGKEIDDRALLPVCKKGAFARMRFCGKVPLNAASVAFAIGKDDPNVAPGERIEMRGATFTQIPAGESIPGEIVPDIRPPMVRSLFSAPTTDRNVAVRYEISDESSIDWGSVTVSNAVSGKIVPFTRSGSEITLENAGPWPEGVNMLTIAASDVHGNRTESKKAFLIGKPPSTPRITLRDDGVTLVDGKPFLPIGIFGVKRLAFNAWDFDRALGDLKAAGFNFAHSYSDGWSPEFHAAVRKHGMMSWTAGYGAVRGDRWIVDTGRNDPSILSWYIGDDTSRNTAPGLLLDRHEACRMLDGTRITCQADSVGGRGVKSCYEEFVDCTDVFMPEMYWTYYKDRKQDARCVACVISDMERVRSDIAKFGKGKPHGVWAILQAFHGRMWQRFPDEDELVATSFAALIHGGTGITWFHYAGELCPERKRRYSGIFQSQKDWAVMTNLATRISSLAPVLLERTPPQPKAPVVLSGAKTDPLGQPSVSVLVKRHEGVTYVFSVNASPDPVRARLFADLPDAAGAVMWENRGIKADGGFFDDDFKGFDVHVYRFGGGSR